MSKGSEQVKRYLRILLIIHVLLALLGQVMVAFSQGEAEATLSLHFRRDFGYALGGQMQGKFTITAEGPQDLARVEFLLDGQVIGHDTEAPFKLAFDTGPYPEGSHRFSAVGYRADGGQLQSETISREFVAGNKVTIIIVAVVALIIFFWGLSHLMTRRSGSAKAGYGLLGGAVCPNCGRAFPIHWWSLRLGFGRFDRCPNCGKWHMAHRASAVALQAAEETFGDKDVPVDQGESAAREEEFKKLLDESRYDQS
jgi:ssDNA-binding Zn-finger/Zn-ribbon topoisomerase 1